MTQTFSREDFVELSYSQLVQENSFKTYKIPECLGEGYFQEIELFPGLELAIYDNEYHDDVVVKIPVRDHPIQFNILLSGFVHHDDYPSIGGKYGYLSGNGIAQAVTSKYQKLQRQVGIGVHLEPEVLETFLAEDLEQFPTHLKPLIHNNDWQVVFSPQVTLGMQVATQRIINSPFQGVTKRLCLQGKVLELLAMMLEGISCDRDPNPTLPRFKPETIARLHHAKEILATQLENPPLLTELAFLVGVSDRTLQRGFRELFGTTVVGYLTYQRMKRAEQLLRQQNRTVAEIARMVGYGHMGHFAAAFKRQFGMTPRECLVGKKAVLGSKNAV
ncbi:helix-turn-helix transcriptional regulator [Gloeocapsopsis crepidinum LEGE 06123]|uniref:Helix-turn-helix transcriptional regulator n=1 Tax=Gloeocapsopsis crepidinum LEGE 06123 TaxID=588587 RepID=A0ABR9UWM5_9CHRO|nr:AraC family transcriptional regulator [Gloeocapsopsis crepidinum]MBE9192708.1 helix-turn-helix transcriptional regulator [Gloeocapsopsis crepidinum LEGE 06123]